MTAFQQTSSIQPMGSPIDWPAQLNQHRSWLISVLRSRINNPHVVEDLYQEVSLAVLRQPSRPTDPDKVAPWLYRLAVRHVINFHRKTGRQQLADSDNEHHPCHLRTAGLHHAFRWNP